MIGRTRGWWAALTLLLLAFATTTSPAAAAPYDCTNSDGGTSSFCQRTHDLGPAGWAVVIGLILVIILGIGWWLRTREIRRERRARRARGWRRFLRRRRESRF